MVLQPLSSRLEVPAGLQASPQKSGVLDEAREGQPTYPPARNVYENNSLRIIGRFLMGLVEMGSEWFSLFLRIFPLFPRIFSPFFSLLSLLLLNDKGKQQQFTAKMGNFTPTPSAPTPCKTSRNHFSEFLRNVAPSKSPGRKDFCKKVLLQFVIYQK